MLTMPMPSFIVTLQVSMLIISAVVPQRQIPALCGALLDFIRKYAPGDVHITLAGGALLGKARESGGC